LLKSLEEPPAGSFFMLIAHRPGRLLPTIRSRCRTLLFPKLSDEQVGSILTREAPGADQATRDAAIAASGGSPGAALEFVQLDLGTMYRLMREIVDKGDTTFDRRGRLSDALGARPDRKRQLAVIDLARAVVAERARSASLSSVPLMTEVHAELVRLGAQAPTYNFDPGLLVMEIGTLLASLAVPSEPAYG
jgi:DNA polymerase-3 subunit delta'